MVTQLKTIKRNIIPALLLAAGMIFWSSCSTGIESTKKIKMTKEDVKLMAKTPEQIFAESLRGEPLSLWEKGREFMGMSDRTLYVFEPTGLTSELTDQSLNGKTLKYTGIDSYQTPDLKEECVILFSDGIHTYRYKTSESTTEAMKQIDSNKLHLLSDIRLINLWKEKISGMTLWTKSNLWYDASGDRIPGYKFTKVRVDDVEPTSGDFPMRVKITGPNGIEGYLQMNYTSDVHDSRNFSALFFLSDPKEKYPQIREENWELIQKGKVGLGMTKEECKLAIGNPDELRSGHNRDQTMDIWQYSDGTYLFFTDGLLNEFRQ